MLLWILLAVFGAPVDYTETTAAGTKSTDLADYATGQTAALACPPGTFFEGSSCEICPAGKFGYDGITCLNCAAGFSSHAGATACDGCAAGKYSVDGSVCVVCAAGRFSDFGSPICKDCPVGTTSAAGAQSLSLCMSSTSIALASPQPERYEITEDAERAPLENALELHNDAQEAQERAQIAQQDAEMEMAEAKEAHHNKMEAEAELFEVKEKYTEVFHEKMDAEENQRNANVRYEEEQFEAEMAEKKSP